MTTQLAERRPYCAGVPESPTRAFCRRVPPGNQRWCHQCRVLRDYYKRQSARRILRAVRTVPDYIPESGEYSAMIVTRLTRERDSLLRALEHRHG